MTTRQQHLYNFTQKCLDMYRREFSKILSPTDISAINCGTLEKNDMTNLNDDIRNTVKS